MKRIVLILAPMTLGVLVLFALIKTHDEPRQAPIAERVYTVRVIAAPSVDMVPRVSAYGEVAPGRVWTATAEVTGKVVYTHPQLDAGEFLPADTEILRIDPTDYELTVSQINADIAATRAQLTENQVQERNIRELLAIEKESLDLSGQELARQRKLAGQGALSQTALDSQERSVLGQRQSVVTQENALRLLPVERERLRAQLRRYQAQLEAAERDLERTAFHLPFSARIGEVNVELNESVRIGDVLVAADDISIAEIKAEVPMQRARDTLISRREPISSLEDFSMSEFLKHVKARVRLADIDVSWHARLVRLSPNLDPQTRTVGAIVEVSDHYQNAIPGVRPPLVKDMFVQVDFWGVPRPNSVVIPRTALHASKVYVVNAEQRLEIRPVTVGLKQAEFVSISAGLDPGTQVVVSDLAPAIEGMALDPQADQTTLSRLLNLAAGHDQ